MKSTSVLEKEKKRDIILMLFFYIYRNIICKNPLPLRHEDLEKHYFISRDKQHIIEAKKAADNHEYCVNAFNDSIYDTSSVITRGTIDDISIELVKILVKVKKKKNSSSLKQIW